MTSETMVKALQALEFTHDLEPRHLEKLASMAEAIDFAKDEFIFRENIVDDKIYLVQAGQAALDIHVPGRGRTTILTAGPGQILGWSSLIPPHRKTATARALIPTKVIALKASQLWAACQADHDLGFTVMWRVAQVIAGRLSATRLQLLDIFALSG